MAIVFVFDYLHKDFHITIANILKLDNKIIDQIWNILQSKKKKHY